MRLAPADYVSLRRGHLSQGGNGQLCSRLLDVANDGVQQHDSADRQRLVWQRGIPFVQPEARRNRGGNDEQQDEDVLKLPEESFPAGYWRLGGQFVGAVSEKAAARVSRVQSALRIALQRAEDYVDRVPVRGVHSHGN